MAPAFFPAPAETRPEHRYWLHLLLLLVTGLSMTVVGAGMAQTFAQNRPVDFNAILDSYLLIWRQPMHLLDGLSFSLTLIFILLGHEFGHYLTARYYHVDASLPYFLPFPTIIGTLGAFIRIRSVILSKKALFDIGIAGPLAGFALLLGPLAVGVGLSHVQPGIAERGDLIFGTPLLMRLFEMIQFRNVPETDILLHPVARAAWAGLLATALNLLPIGQLDGGHILYAFLGEKTKLTTRLFVACVAALGFYQLFTTSYKAGYSWLLWAGILFFFAMRHPPIVDRTPVGTVRGWLAIASLIIFILSFTPVPIRTS
jgi:membrane-associated protease RseP (regulator of RpoE activity)